MIKSNQKTANGKDFSIFKTLLKLITPLPYNIPKTFRCRPWRSNRKIYMRLSRESLSVPNWKVLPGRDLTQKKNCLNLHCLCKKYTKMNRRYSIKTQKRSPPSWSSRKYKPPLKFANIRGSPSSNLKTTTDPKAGSFIRDLCLAHLIITSGYWKKSILIRNLKEKRKLKTFIALNLTANSKEGTSTLHFRYNYWYIRVAEL